MTTPLTLLLLESPAPILAEVQRAAGPEARVLPVDSLDTLPERPDVHAALLPASHLEGSPLPTIQAVRAHYPYAQVGFIGTSSELAQLRQRLILVSVLNEQWTYLPTDHPERWPSLLGEARAKSERRQALKMTSARPPVTGKPTSAPRSLEAPYLASILQHAREAILFLDLKARVTYWNRAAESLYGIPAAMPPGWPFEERVAPEWLPEFRRLIQDIVSQRGDFLVQLVHLAATGRRIPVEQSMAPVNDWRGQLIGISLMVRDISDRLEAERAQRLEIERETEQAFVEELQAANEELEMQAHELQQKQAELRTLAEELRRTNATIQAEVDARTRELASRSQELETANQQLVEADRYKDEFLSVISHELRTPLNFITGVASILGDEVSGPLNAKQHEQVDKILSGADRMLVLVNNLLDMSRMAAGKFHLTPQQTSYPPLVEEVVSTMQPLAAEKRLSIRTDVEDPGPLMMDGPRIIQVLTNLIGNAIKFTPPGGLIAVRVRRQGPELLTEIRDTGPGISPENLPKLFQRFGQLDMSTTRASGGTGLGLSISKALVDSHGGRIGVSSRPGQGSTFWFALPLNPGKAPPSSPSIRQPPENIGKG